MKRKKKIKVKKMDQTKTEISKPILSPTRSLDEGFESDPDRISNTDSEATSPSAQTPTFDLHHCTDRDGVQHTTITRHTLPISSIINCIDGGLESDGSLANNNSGDDSKVEQSSPKSDQKQHTYRRVKNKAPLPPSKSKSVASSNNSNAAYQTIQPRSQSVDRIRFNKSSNQNILAGRFVRVTVDPKQQYLNYFKSFKSYQNYQTSSGKLLSATATTGSVNNLYRNYQQPSSISKSCSVNSISHEHQPISGLLSLSNLSSSIMPMQSSQYNGYSTVKPKSYHKSHFSSHHHHIQSQQSHFLASSWTLSLDPRKARK